MMLNSIKKRNFKKCRVCGDKALAFNFNGLSCESCKAFFRRNGLKSKKIKCISVGKCEINFDNRRKCPKCRLEKCLEIGMKPELLFITHEEKSHKRKLKINDIPQTPDSSSSHSTESTSKSIENNSILKLKSYEQFLFKEVKDSTFYDTTENVKGEAQDFTHVFRLQEYYIKEIVGFCNQFAAFQCLPQEDKLIRIKGAFIELLLLRAAFYFVKDKDGFTMKANHSGDHYVFVSLNRFLSSISKTLIHEFRKFLTSFFEELEEDEDLKDLIAVLLLFKTNNRHIQRIEFIRYQYHVYNLLLFRYLEQKFDSTEEALNKHENIMCYLEEIGGLKRTFKHMFSEMISDMSDGIAHVLAEIYHLNNYSSE